MMTMTRRFALLMGVMIVGGTATGAPAPAPLTVDPATAEIARKVEASKDPAVWKQGLVDLDALIAKDGKLPFAHYKRGQILSALGQREEALAAYDRAVALAPKLVDALYNAGVVLADLGRKKEAIGYWDKALKIDPKLVDAAYNGGQAAYDLKDFKGALKRFSVVAKLTPEDFDAHKKVMQAQLALGQDKPAWKTRDVLFALWKAGKGPGNGKAPEYVLDQFDVATRHVFVYETFAPTGDLAYVYTFKVQDPSGNKTAFSVQLETSAAIREMGTPYVLGMSLPKGHVTTGQGFKALPAYKAVRTAAQKLIAEQLAAK